MKTILVTGGAGYIGSHVCKALKNEGFLPVTFDNLSHGHEWAIQWGPFLRGNILSIDDLDRAIKEYKPDGVIHLAGSIHLRESFEDPALHYENNVVGTLNVLKAITTHGIRQLVFSSSAAVYAPIDAGALTEESPKAPTSPYGKTKWIAEQMFEDFALAHGISITSLRYFNAAGADAEGTIGEAHHPETHLIPCLIEAAQNNTGTFTIYNSTLTTPDGTAIRDYIHVSDLASGHVAALKWLFQNEGATSFNLGTGTGYSVKQMIQAVEQITGKPINVQLKKLPVPEAPMLIADPTKASKILGWTPTHSSLSNIIQTAWDWHTSREPATL